MAFELPSLPYEYDALEPVMSKETLEYHHDKHHNAYVVNANKLIDGSGLENKSLEDTIKTSYLSAKGGGLFNNVAQHWNHIEFWKWMKPNGGGAIPGALEKKIISDFGSIEAMKEEFIKFGVGQFGSGWVWLILGQEGKLYVTNTSNGINPLAIGNGIALLGCDVWEHSYYIDYRNARIDYIRAFVSNLVNWERVADIFHQSY
ncbi:superoxide dismutase (Mn) [Candidatus Endolissoclinum faulkneri L2]|uniref:Superoxide dismutase n=1 Tax=Candidatus Endolissoclinum faulkneri L2 TaxID=1193729 RepID=K7YPS3_9PROT|nr:superoxide dismutase [Candidatus Endolissoclinum faulkneri]AFX99527.1 superoxide dismutase (Mn) [Candidatus Endolissoclinum faulkneri L2]